METDNIEDYNDVANKVDENGGVISIKMEVLKRVHEVDRLGRIVRENISEKLNGRGLGHYPKRSLPSSQDDYVRIYRRSTEIGKLVEAVTDPGEPGDETIRKMVDSDAEQTIERIQELVCDL